MIGRRKKDHDLGMTRLYAYQGKKGRTYYTITPGNKYINLGSDLRAAKAKLLELDGEAALAGTIADHLGDLLKERQKKVGQGKLSARTLEDNRREAEQLNKAFGKMPPEALKPSHVWQYLHKFRGAVAPVRANREIALLSSLFNRLRGAGVVDHNPCANVERNEESPRERLVTEAELRRFINFAAGRGESGKRMAIAACLAYVTGKAQAQILKMRRDQLTEEGIRFEKRKRGAATIVQWTPGLEEVVGQAARLTPEGVVTIYVLSTTSGSAYTADGFKSIWHRVMKAWEEAGNERFTFHDIRAASVSELSEQGRKASELTGHLTEGIVEKVYDRRRVRKALAVK